MFQVISYNDEIERVYFNWRSSLTKVVAVLPNRYAVGDGVGTT